MRAVWRQRCTRDSLSLRHRLGHSYTTTSNQNDHKIASKKPWWFSPQHSTLLLPLPSSTTTSSSRSPVYPSPVQNPNWLSRVQLLREALLKESQAQNTSISDSRASLYRTFKQVDPKSYYAVYNNNNNNNNNKDPEDPPPLQNVSDTAKKVADQIQFLNTTVSQNIDLRHPSPSNNSKETKHNPVKQYLALRKHFKGECFRQNFGQLLPSTFASMVTTSLKYHKFRHLSATVNKHMLHLSRINTSDIQDGNTQQRLVEIEIAALLALLRRPLTVLVPSSSSKEQIRERIQRLQGQREKLWQRLLYLLEHHPEKNVVQFIAFDSLLTLAQYRCTLDFPPGSIIRQLWLLGLNENFAHSNISLKAAITILGMLTNGNRSLEQVLDPNQDQIYQQHQQETKIEETDSNRTMYLTLALELLEDLVSLRPSLSPCLTYIDIIPLPGDDDSFSLDLVQSHLLRALSLAASDSQLHYHAISFLDNIKDAVPDYALVDLKKTKPTTALNDTELAKQVILRALSLQEKSRVIKVGNFLMAHSPAPNQGSTCWTPILSNSDILDHFTTVAIKSGIPAKPAEIFLGFNRGRGSLEELVIILDVYLSNIYRSSLLRPQMDMYKRNVAETFFGFGPGSGLDNESENMAYEILNSFGLFKDDQSSHHLPEPILTQILELLVKYNMVNLLQRIVRNILTTNHKIRRGSATQQRESGRSSGVFKIPQRVMASLCKNFNKSDLNFCKAIISDFLLSRRKSRNLEQLKDQEPVQSRSEGQNQNQLQHKHQHQHQKKLEHPNLLDIYDLNHAECNSLAQCYFMNNDIDHGFMVYRHMLDKKMTIDSYDIACMLSVIITKNPYWCMHILKMLIRKHFYVNDVVIATLISRARVRMSNLNSEIRNQQEGASKRRTGNLIPPEAAQVPSWEETFLIELSNIYNIKFHMNSRRTIFRPHPLMSLDTQLHSLRRLYATNGFFLTKSSFQAVLFSCAQRKKSLLHTVELLDFASSQKFSLQASWLQLCLQFALDELQLHTTKITRKGLSAEDTRYLCTELVHKVLTCVSVLTCEPSDKQYYTLIKLYQLMMTICMKTENLSLADRIIHQFNYQLQDVTINEDTRKTFDFFANFLYWVYMKQKHFQFMVQMLLMAHQIPPN